MLAENTERFINFRNRHPELADRIIDSKYSDLVADPLAVVRTIYARAEIPLHEAQAERVRQLASNRSRYRSRRTGTELSRLKFIAGVELRRFERYCLRFGLPFHGAD